MKNRSRVAVAVSSLLLAQWALPASAQDAASSPPRVGTQRKSGTKKSSSGTTSSSGAKSTGTLKSSGTARSSGPTKAGATGKSGAKRKGQGKADAAQEPATDTPAASLSESLPMPPPPPPRPPAEQPGNTLDASSGRPWAQGVSSEDQATTMALFAEGNTLLKESIFVRAAEKYRQALQRWDHPAIHYNLALALMNLDQPVEVHEQLVAAMKFGPEPLEKEKYEYARNYKTLVEGQLARVEITCDSPGATVTMDGQTLFVAPGRFEGLVRPGAHSIVATREGFVPSDQSQTLLPGKTATLDLKMLTSEDLIRYKRRWSAAMPWLVMGAGAVVAGGSAFLHMQSRDHFRAFEAGVAECGGCVPPPAVADQRSQGNLMQRGAITGYALGGAAVVTGAVLAFVNQPKPYRIDSQQASAPTVDVTPVVGAGTGGALATLRF